MFKKLMGIIGLILLSGCSNDINEDTQDEIIPIQITTELSTPEGGIYGFVSKDGVEILYGHGFFATRQNNNNWQTEVSSDFYIFGASIINNEHWIITVVRGISDQSNSPIFYIEETLNSGIEWSKRIIAIESVNAEYFSALTYDYPNNKLYVAVDIGLASTSLPVEDFTLLYRRNALTGVAKKLILNPSRDQLWWIGSLSLASAGGQLNDAVIKRYNLTDETMIPEDLSTSVGLSSVTGGSIHKNNPNIIFISGREGILRTEDGGASWVNIFSPGYQTANIVTYEPGNRLYTGYKRQNKINILCSENLGDNWVESQTKELAMNGELTLFEISGNWLMLGVNNQSIFSVALDEVKCN